MVFIKLVSASSRIATLQFEEDSIAQTVFEIYQENGHRFPFRITNASPRHFLAEVFCFGFLRPVRLPGLSERTEEVIGIHLFEEEQVIKGDGRFICNLYWLRDQSLYKQAVYVNGAEQPIWLPR